jgi:hypothetical protein
MSLLLVPHPNDRRRRPRVPADFTLDALDGGPELVAQDVGIGGMLVSTTRARWPGQHIPVRFKLPRTRRAIRATCRVLELVEVPKGVGLSLQFLQLAPKAQLEVLRYVQDRLEAMHQGGRAMAAAPI